MTPASGPRRAARRASPTRRADRGSLLITALLISAIISISLVSYLKLSGTTLKLAQRSFLNNSAMNLSETGLELALQAINRNQSYGVAIDTAWSGWTRNTATSPHYATRTVAISPAPAPNASGAVKVYVENFDLTGQPKIVARATVTPGDGGPDIVKYVEVQLSTRSLWGGGLVAKTSFTGDSNTYVDSWLSGGTTLYSTGVKRAGGPIGVVASGSGALNIGDNASVYGTANTGGGTVSKTGASKLTNSVTGTGWNTTLERHDFTMTFPAITVPSPASVNLITTSITANATFPRVGDVAVAGVYYYNFGVGTKINYASNTMTIKQPCVFIFANHAGVACMSSSSAATFTYGTAVGDNGSLTIYTNGNINFDSGASFFVNGVPSRTLIYGTGTTSQTFVTRGGGNFYGCIYAPNAAMTLDSGVSLFGAYVVNSVQLLGGCKFHYDETLAAGSGGSSYKINKWKELKTADERNTYATKLSL